MNSPGREKRGYTAEHNSVRAAQVVTVASCAAYTCVKGWV